MKLFRSNAALVAILSISCWAACSSAPKNSQHPGEKAAAESDSKTPTATRAVALSHEAALARAKQVFHVSYNLWFGLDDESNTFQGRTTLNFELRPKAKEYGKKIAVDLEEGTLRSVNVNGQSINDLSNPDRFDGHHLYLNLSELTPSLNKIEIAYNHSYSADGNGLHRFKDPEDGKIYIYSHFEPYYAHRVFPCFDQPDLKASYELTVETPKDWVAISNTTPKEPTHVDGRQSWSFPSSSVFSPYVFALHAGPYSVWKGDASGIPLRLYARKSLAKYVDHEEWLDVTRKGLDFYGTQFGFPYPFSKYDQIIVPDFNAGAMENVGAVTFSERFVFRTRVTTDRRLTRAEVILHEMAHMWFGDLVTMKWWNGLWLNESFATFMSFNALDQATSFHGAWQSFFNSEKQSAYWEDQLVTTHPVELPVPNTDYAEANFDGITYGKGASSLKQLSFYLSEDDFKEGLQRYFQKYAYHNTTIGEFMKMLSEASSQDVIAWQKTWLQTSGVNTVRAEWACEEDSKGKNSRISSFKLVQTGATDPLSPTGYSSELRPHRTQVAFFNFPRGRARETGPLTVTKTLDVTYAAAETSVLEAVGKPCPDFVFPNHTDQDYVKVDLDPISLKVASTKLSHFEDPFVRQMLWHTLWDLVVSANLSAQEYADTVMSEGEHEKDTKILSKILHNLVDANPIHSSVLKFLSGDLEKKYRGDIESFVFKHLLKAPKGSDLQLVWFQSFLDIASSAKSVTYLTALLEGDQKLHGLDMDQDRRWEIIKSLARNNADNIKETITEELDDDVTDMGQRYAIASEAIIPSLEEKTKWLTTLSQPDGHLPLAKMREGMWNFLSLGQGEFWKTFGVTLRDTYFNTLAKIATSTSTEDDEYAKIYSRSMYPSFCDPEDVRLTTEFLNNHPGLPASVSKNLKIGRQEEERCIQARKKSDH